MGRLNLEFSYVGGFFTILLLCLIINGMEWILKWHQLLIIGFSMALLVDLLKFASNVIVFLAEPSLEEKTSGNTVAINLRYADDDSADDDSADDDSADDDSADDDSADDDSADDDSADDDSADEVISQHGEVFTFRKNSDFKKNNIISRR